jgi:hypothetical protein
MTNVEEKIEAVKSRFAGGHLLAIRWNSLLHTREFVVIKTYISIVWRRLA